MNNYDLFIYLKQVIPMLMFISFLFLKNIKSKKIDYICYGVFLSIISIFIYVLILFKMGVGFREYTGIKWNSYIIPIEWLLFLIVGFILAKIRMGDSIHSLNYITQSVSTCGWLYELPVYHPISMFFHPSLPYMVNTQILSLFFLMYSLWVKKFKVNMRVVLFIMFYLLFSLLYYITKMRFPLIPHLGTIISRLPTMIMLLSLLWGIEK